jgi:plastocyanin
MTSTRGRHFAVVAVLVLAALGATAAPAAEQKPTANAKAAQVTIDNFTFKPGTITVPVGTTITWTNRDDMPHTVVAEDHSFRSGALDTDESFSHTFAEPGTFVYYCSIHTKMVGKVIVEKK